MKELQKIIDKYKSDAEIFELVDCYSCCNFPFKVEKPIIDYIDCNFEIISKDKYSVQFKNK